MGIIEDAERIKNYEKRIKDKCIEKYGKEIGNMIANKNFSYVSQLMKLLKAKLESKKFKSESSYFKYYLVIRVYDLFSYDAYEYMILLSRRAGYMELSHCFEEALDLIPLYIEFKNYLKEWGVDGFLKSISLEQLNDIAYLSRLELEYYRLLEDKNGKNYKNKLENICSGMFAASEYHDERLDDIIKQEKPMVMLERKYSHHDIKALMLLSPWKIVS